MYIVENKIVAGKEHRGYEGEALGMKMMITFFERPPDAPGILRRVNRENLSMQQDLLTVAELLQTLGFALPPDPDRTAAMSEQLIEAHYANLRIWRFACKEEPAHPEPLMFSMDDREDAEDVYATELDYENLTKMVLARHLHRNEDLNEGETLEDAWNLTKDDLRARTILAFPAPLAPPVAAPPMGRGRGRGMG